MEKYKSREICLFIKKYRIEKSLSVKELAQLSGLTQKIIYQLESRVDYFPNLYTLAKVSKVLDVSIDNLFEIDMSKIHIPADDF